jgi:hypothetical protein
MNQNETAEHTQHSPLVLGGRSFRATDFERRTVMQDHWLMRELRATGADKVMPMDGEANEVYLLRLQTILIDSGKVPDLLGGYLLPAGTSEREWTPSTARDTAKHIALCDMPEDRELVLTLAMEVAFGFFKQGLAWLARSRSSSLRAEVSNALTRTSPAH